MDSEGTAQHVIISLTPPPPTVIMPKQLPAVESQPVCRVCLCADVDPDGEAALSALGIYPPEGSHVYASDADLANFADKIADKAGPTGRRADAAELTGVAGMNNSGQKMEEDKSLKFGDFNENPLIALGCSCRAENGMAHYSCALRWFVLRGEAVCEVCGQAAENVRTDDVATVMAALEERRRGILVQELVSPQFSIREGEELGSSVDHSLGDYQMSSISQRPGVENSDLEVNGQRLSTESQTVTRLHDNQSTSGRLSAVTLTVTASPSRECFGQGGGGGGGGGDSEAIVSPSRNHRLAVALAEHKALLDAIAWFDLQRGEDSFEQVGVLPLSRLRGLWRGNISNEEQPFPRPCFCLSAGTCQFVEACVTIFAMALLAFGFSRIFNKFLSTKLSDMGLDFVMGGAIAILIVIWFRLVVLPRVLLLC